MLDLVCKQMYPGVIFPLLCFTLFVNHSLMHYLKDDM